MSMRHCSRSSLILILRLLTYRTWRASNVQQKEWRQDFEVLSGRTGQHLQSSTPLLLGWTLAATLQGLAAGAATNGSSMFASIEPFGA